MERCAEVGVSATAGPGPARVSLAVTMSIQDRNAAAAASRIRWEDYEDTERVAAWDEALAAARTG